MSQAYRRQGIFIAGAKPRTGLEPVRGFATSRPS